MGIAHRYARLGRTVLATGAVLLAIGLTACSSTTSQSSTSSASVGASAVVSPEAGMMSAPAGTIIDIASGTPDLSTLVTAVNAAGLVDTLNGAGPFTVFAPTDEAFAALPAGVLDALLMPENKDTLAKILTYHVVPGKVMAADVTDGSVATVEGQSVTLSTSNGVTVDGATVVTPDIEASNGVIHVIDAVILPPDVDISSLSAA
ncbi:MAG: fasciclin domain-containing protein [Actinomycetales bacterium]|nr:fasciclin domain-containing protein [Actinomycetales bacterium]